MELTFINERYVFKWLKKFKIREILYGSKMIGKVNRMFGVRTVLLAFRYVYGRALMGFYRLRG